jgi:hypothetical protein
MLIADHLAGRPKRTATPMQWGDPNMFKDNDIEAAVGGDGGG